jgi:hypothetical protein
MRVNETNINVLIFVIYTNTYFGKSDQVHVVYVMNVYRNLSRRAHQEQSNCTQFYSVQLVFND